MRLQSQGYQVAVVGASSLVGKELLAVLEERHFPVTQLVKLEEGGAAELPILDLDEPVVPGTGEDTEISAAELDFAFIAARPDRLPAFLQPDSPRPRAVIDLDQALPELSSAVPRIPLLERGSQPPAAALADRNQPQLVVSAHPATTVLSVLLLRLAAEFELKTAVAQVFNPAASLGSRAIEELQKQTVNLLSFQRIPRSVFGAQLAFNILPRLGGSGSIVMSGLEDRIRGELRRCLADRTPLPALRLFQASVFYSMAISLYVETTKPAAPSAVGRALAGERVRLGRAAEQAPSQVGVTGSTEILVDPIISDGGREAGLWIWAAVDNLRLAAENAVEIAESLAGQRRGASASGSPRAN
jgi:aspartate-semialdehyde dehydrogenase